MLSACINVWIVSGVQVSDRQHLTQLSAAEKQRQLQSSNY
jgi:hypothetical protein